MKPRLRSTFACVCLMTLLSPLSARATIMKYLEIEDLARFSSDIFHGQVMTTGTVWNAERTRIYTVTRVRIHESFKGAARRDQTVSVVQLGGERDGVRMEYAGRPVFTAGESVVLFTTRAPSGELTVVGMKQGKMKVEGVEVARDFAGLTLVDASATGKQARPLALKTVRMPLDELRNRIARLK
jgi:hypothetical protein